MITKTRTMATTSKGSETGFCGGSSFITGRKAIAEAKRAEEERLEKRRAANAKKKKKK